jgi:hypothetical protein
MNSSRIAAIAVTGLAALVTGAAGHSPAADEIRWQSDWESARAAAREGRRPLFVAFR